MKTDPLTEIEWKAHFDAAKAEIDRVGEQADVLEQVLLHCADPETRRYVEQVLESYRLQAIRLNEHLETWIKKKPV